MKGLLFILILSLGIACSPEDALPQSAPCDQDFSAAYLIPGTDCVNPCRYGYAGEVFLPDQPAVIDCRTDYRGFRLFVDSTSLFGPGRVPLKVITLELRGPAGAPLSGFCKHDLWWEAEDADLDMEYKLLFPANPESGIYRAHIIPEPAFWERFRAGRFRFHFSTRRPIGFP